MQCNEEMIYFFYLGTGKLNFSECYAQVSQQKVLAGCNELFPKI